MDSSKTDSESLSDEWPDDYFDFDQPAGSFQEDIFQDHLSKLPQKLLCEIVEPLDLQSRYNVSRCNKALQEAVGASKWFCPGDGTMDIYSYGYITCGLKLGGLHEKGSLDVRTAGLDAADDIHSFFPWFKRLFGQLHLKSLRLHNVTNLQPSRLDGHQHFIDFLDALTYDELFISLTPALKNLFQKRLLSMMAKARKNVVVELDAKEMFLSMTEFVPMERPMTIQLMEQGWKGEARSLPEYLFIDLVCSGHSLLRFNSELSVENLGLIIETVSRAGRNQKLDIRDLDHDVCRGYVDRVQANRVHHNFSLNEFPPEARRQIETYEHLGALIFVHAGYGEGRVIVASERVRDSFVTPWDVFQ